MWDAGYFSGFRIWGVNQPLGGLPFFLSLPFLFSFLIISIHSCPSCPLPFPTPFHFLSPSKVSPLNPARGFGERCKLLAGSGAKPQPKSNLVHFSLKIWHLLATNLKIFLRIEWPNFTQNFPIYAEFGRGALKVVGVVSKLRVLGGVKYHWWGAKLIWAHL